MMRITASLTKAASFNARAGAEETAHSQTEKQPLAKHGAKEHRVSDKDLILPPSGSPSGVLPPGKEPHKCSQAHNSTPPIGSPKVC